VIEDFGLSTALEELCEEFGKAPGITVRFDGPIDDAGLSRDAAACLYRIAQESLGNAAKHGRATEVRVALSAKGGTMQLLVTDNGAGFSGEPWRSRVGLGLVSMKERVRLVNGTFTITSRAGQGTEIIASVPLPLSGGDGETSADSAG
jgi:signal transduction histidine kinase